MSHTRPVNTVFSTACCLLSAVLCTAADWTPVADASSLGFKSSYEGEAFEGRFQKFDAVIAFDPAKLDGSRFEVTIPLSGADTQNPERDETLKGSEFFDAAGKQPQAKYSASKFRALGGDRYVAEGTLSLRGVSKPVPLEFTWTAGAQPVLEGKATVNRLDFGVGGGDWADTELIPNAVQVTTKLTLKPAATR